MSKLSFKLVLKVHYLLNSMRQCFSSFLNVNYEKKIANVLLKKKIIKTVYRDGTR